MLSKSGEILDYGDITGRKNYNLRIISGIDDYEGKFGKITIF
jgi:hypothetical protein|nr:hypothetical protein [Methanothermococcus thermolithotrophicus]